MVEDEFDLTDVVEDEESWGPLSEEEWWESLVEDDYPEPDEDLILAPEESPSVPSMHVDLWHPYKPAGYCHLPQHNRVVPFCRKKYPTLAEAHAAFDEMKARLGWHQVEQPFWSARYWCFRVQTAKGVILDG